MRKPKNIPWQIRQGDVLLEEIKQVPADGVELDREGGRIILAAGDATGHHHAIADQSVRYFRHATADDKRFVQVTREHARGGGEIGHEEHTALPQKTALRTSRVIRQREWTSASVRRVAD